MKWFLILWFVATAVGTIYLSIDNTHSWVGVATKAQFLVVCVIVYPALMWVLFRYHRYEFNVNKVHSFWFFVLFMLMQG